MNKSNAKEYIYRPHSWLVNEHIIIYDIVLSLCKTKIYIFFNTMLHMCDKNFDTNILSKRYRNYLINLKKNLKTQYFNTDTDINISSDDIDIISFKWINSVNLNFKFAYELTLRTPLISDTVELDINMCSINHKFNCFFSKLYEQTGDISAVIHFKNENEFLDKWIEHYKKLGVNQFYIYNNNPDNHTEYDNLLKKYNNIVFLDWGFNFDMPYGFSQMCCFNHSLNLLRNRFKWVLYTDIDEYVVIKNKTGTFTELIKKYDLSKIASLNFQCMWFGCANNVDYNPQNFLKNLIKTSGKAVYEKTKDKKHYRNSKCLHNPLLNTVIGNHVSLETQGEQIILKPSVIRFNHYFTITTWGRDRFFSKSWDKSDKYKFKKKCNCNEICKEINTELLDIYHKST